MRQNIGFIGLGAMGLPMALNLIGAGYRVTSTWHSRRTPADKLSVAGGVIVDGVVEVAKAADVLITVLPADCELREVYLGGVLDNIPEGSVCIDMTSALPDTIIEVAAEAARKNVDVLDAPVSGGISRAEAGSLTIMAGGDNRVLDSCRDILEVLGGQIYHTGAVGSGKGFKMINQLLNAGNTLIISEALHLARHMSLDIDRLIDVVNRSSGGSWVFANKVPNFIAPGSFDPGFKLELMSKDVDLNIGYARKNNIVLPFAEMISDIFRASLNQDNAGRDYTVVSRWIEQRNRRENEHL